MRIPPILRELGGAAILATIGMTTVAAWHFPYAIDDPLNREDALRAFYAGSEAVAQTTPSGGELDGSATDRAHSRSGGRVAEFVDVFDLHDARVLDVGSRTGHLQDVVEDYTGLDTSSGAVRFYHKRFVTGTATAMPFDDNSFDAAWSISALEHTSNPETALAEIRRVVKPGGVLYLSAAWHLPSWAADGYDARPYGELDLRGKLLKASIPLRRSEPFQVMTILPARGVRAAISSLGPTRLHYRRLTPEHTQGEQAGGPAVNSLDPIEVAMWFESRGDACLNCLSGWRRLWQPDTPLVIRVGQRGKKGTTTVRDHREPKPSPLSTRRPGYHS